MKRYPIGSIITSNEVVFISINKLGITVYFCKFIGTWFEFLVYLERTYKTKAQAILGMVEVVRTYKLVEKHLALLQQTI